MSDRALPKTEDAQFIDDKADALLAAIDEFLDAKVSGSLGVAKYDAISDAKTDLFEQLMAAI